MKGLSTGNNSVLHTSYFVRFRWAIRFIVLATAVLLLLPGGRWDLLRLAVPSASPYTAIASLVATRTLRLAALFALPVFVLALLRRRWFCRYACPTGLLCDLAGRLRRRRAVSVRRVPPLGHWLALATLGGACLGYPLFLWLDPLALFAGFVHAWPRGPAAAAWLCAAGLPLLLLISLLWPGVWCLRICPLGATQEMLAWPRARWRHRRRHGSLQGWPLLRRTAIAGVLGGLGANVLLRHAAAARRKPLRPPGAREEGRFLGLCQRCGGCARVCPSGILHPDLGQSGVAGFLTPVVQYDDRYCLETCQRCTHICPSGALRPLAAAEKLRAAIGLARVDMSVCLLGDDHECGVCRNYCPVAAIKIVFDETSYLSVPRVDTEACNGCGACQVQCPTQPKAIVVSPC